MTGKQFYLNYTAVYYYIILYISL